MRPIILVAILALSGCTAATGSALAPDVPYAAPTPPVISPAYRAVENGRFELTRSVRFETKAFGPVVLTKGYRSDGSSSPIADVEATRLAGFLHDALYSASGHLRFPKGAPKRWTKAQADDAYCDEMVKRGAPAWHANANCLGVRTLQRIAGSWERLGPKREKRWVTHRARWEGRRKGR